MRYWARKDAQNNITTVESYSHDLKIEGAVEITEQEFNDLIASLPSLPSPPDWKTEWKTATTATQRLAVLARMLGLE